MFHNCLNIRSLLPDRATPIYIPLIFTPSSRECSVWRESRVSPRPVCVRYVILVARHVESRRLMPSFRRSKGTSPASNPCAAVRQGRGEMMTPATPLWPVCWRLISWSQRHVGVLGLGWDHLCGALVHLGQAKDAGAVRGKKEIVQTPQFLERLDCDWVSFDILPTCPSSNVECPGVNPASCQRLVGEIVHHRRRAQLRKISVHCEVEACTSKSGSYPLYGT